MLPLLLSASFIGLIHSFAPGHWLPIILLAKSHRWPLSRALGGAVVASLGHILVALIMGLLVMILGATLVHYNFEAIENYSGYFIGAFGIIYAMSSLFRHSHCESHAHHGPEIPKSKSLKKRLPYVFLFSIGLSPCIAVLPVIIAAIPVGNLAVSLTVFAYCLGVVLALVSATLMVSLGISKLDHPVFEHYGDVITGLTVALMGFTLLI
jgi:nickel/cobalt transporter (NicO) family protein